jgi:group II intron reverse transcriptase/maturase
MAKGMQVVQLTKQREVCEMQKAEVVLTVLRKKSMQDKDFVFDRLYRNLFNPDFYMLAYSNMYAKEGNMTPGTDGKTIDGFNISLINGLIEEIKNETYYPNPSKRAYIKKKNGKLRPLGIPSFRDKLVQEVLRMLLEAIYEPIFRDSSHGFRPDKSCHTALLQVKNTCHGSTWAVEGDIKGFFDNIDHSIMLSLLSKKIADGRIIELVRRFLKAGYFEFHQVRDSLTGTPQGNGTSPILANIYLHELDIFTEETCRKHSTDKKSKKHSPAYNKLFVARRAAKKRGDYKQADKILGEMRKLPSRDTMDSGYIRVHYVRYADDFLVMVNGSKALASILKAEIGGFLKDKLNLELSEEKTLITHLPSNNARFLGYEIQNAHNDTAISQDSKGRRFRSINGTIQLLVPTDVINSKLRAFTKGKKAAARPERVNDPVLNTLTAYNAEIQGLYNFYRLATDVSTKLYKFKHYHYDSLLKTIAQKEKTSISKVLKKYGISVPRKQGTGTRRIFGVNYVTKDGLRTRTYFNESLRKMDSPCPGKGADGIAVSAYTPRHQVIDRYNARKCELCGFESENLNNFEIHHVRKLRDVKEKYARRGSSMPLWVLKMSALSRKTLIVCKPCHNSIHRGEMNKSLKKAMEKK